MSIPVLSYPPIDNATFFLLQWRPGRDVTHGDDSPYHGQTV